MDVFTKEKRSYVMSRIRSSGNSSTELRLKNVFNEYGIKGWRRGIKMLGKPDFVFQKLKIAVFVDGCFWHACSYCGTGPKSKKKYWRDKLSRNKRRDRLVSRTLRSDGWSVFRVKECRLKKYPLLQAQRISKCIIEKCTEKNFSLECYFNYSA